MPKKIITGKIISLDKNETAKVATERLLTHKKYHKKYKVSKNYLTHNPQNKYKLDDQVKIQETKPISKNKRFVIIKKVK